jgi:hypothetical protein
MMIRNSYFDRSLVARIIGETLVVAALTWSFGWDWHLAMAFMAAIIAAELLRFRNSLAVRQRSLPQNRPVPSEHSLASRARAASAIVLWLVEISSLALAARGIVLWFTVPDRQFTALFAAAFFGLCAALTAYMLVLRIRG